MNGTRRESIRGFSLIELTLALLALGVIGLLVSGAYRDDHGNQAAASARAETEQARRALHGFLLSQRRLPCPDSSGNGREGDVAGVCAPGMSVGWLPYETLQLSAQPPHRIVYAVYRNTAANADLVRPTDPGNGSGSYEYDAFAAIQRTLTAAAAQPLTDTHPYLTDDDAALGPVDCTGTITANPAFVLLAGASDRTGNGDPFDGIHTGYGSSPGRCFAAPTLSFSRSYDDVVLVDSAHTLLGWLTAGAR